MEKLNMQKLYDDYNCKKDYEKMMLSELIFLILSEPANKTGYRPEMRDELRKFLYRDFCGTSEEKLLGVAGYFSNDLGDIFVKAVDFDTNQNIFHSLFSSISNLETINGVVFKL